MYLRSLHSTALACLCVLTPLSAARIDRDADGLPDVWQQRYRADHLAPERDKDKDGYTNAEEAEAGTDPFDPSDYPQFATVTADPTSEQVTLTFPTQSGKLYQLHESTSLGGFNILGPVVLGDGLPYTLDVAADFSTISGNVLLEQWSDVTGNSISTLTDLPTFPFNPDGYSRLSSLETTPLLAAGFGGRLVTFITPPETGSYSFFLSSGSSAELLLSTSTDPDDLVKVAEVLSAQTDIEPSVWDQYDSQRSVPISLTAGQSYLLQVNYLAHTAESHCQVGWTGPTITGVEVISESHLSPTAIPATSYSPTPMYTRDYEESADLIWPLSTLVTAPTGMSGSAEYISTDPGARTDETIALGESTTDHFYARFLVNMGTTNHNVGLYFQDTDTTDAEGPRIDFELRNSNTIPSIRAGGSGGSDSNSDIDLNHTYRVELLAALDTPFTYGFDQSFRSVAADTFDLYISDPLTDELLYTHRGLTFRDGADVLTSIDHLRISIGTSTVPDIYFDDWHFTAGAIDGNGILQPNLSAAPNGHEAKRFFCLTIDDNDQDGDGLSDWEEIVLGQNAPYLYFDDQTQDGQDDATELESQLDSATGDITVTLQASDTAAFEDNSPNISEDHGEITITRTGPITPITVSLCIAPLSDTGNTTTICDGTCCTLVGTAGDEAAEPEDYLLIDEEGNTITDTVAFAFGEMTKVITVKAIKDTINEYPETLNIALATPADDAGYLLSDTNGASIQLFDLPDSPSNYAVFTGLYSQDGNAVSTTSGSGSTSAILNGPRTQLLITTEFSGLTSAQQDAHIHKSNPGASAGDKVGPIIYEITNIPGDSTSGILLGSLDNYLWDLSESAGTVPTAGGAASKQAIIDSLFGQNGETPLYFNVHTVDNPAGEIWSFLGITGGSIEDPGTPPADATPGSASYALLEGEDLEAEVRRFLDQATFGATEDDVTALLSTINDTRATDPTYHRHAAFSAWIDEQMALPQTYILDHHLALDFQQAKLRGWFDATLNPEHKTLPGVTVPDLPATWPTIDRSHTDPNKWHLTDTYPWHRLHEYLVQRNGNGSRPGDSNRRVANWQMMLNAQDQLRQKMGFALQQIVVVSVTNNTIRNSHYSSGHYVDMLNHYAFGHYRDVLGFANWNPIMGKWLTSLQNQKGLDVDGDGINDTSPDENLARENMQLFSIGLFDLWPDGTLKLGTDGAPNNTYTNDDIKEFAKILTGQSFSVSENLTSFWGGVPYEDQPANTNFTFTQSQSLLYGQKYIYPMAMFGDYHDRSAKTFAGVTIDNTHLTDPQEQGVADIESALDWLAGKPGDGEPDFDMVNSHISTPAFISRRLIQRFVTSNPSTDYLHRVATTFKDNEGDLALTLKAILLDSEARTLDFTNEKAGMKRSPMETLMQISRRLDAFTTTPIAPTDGSFPFDTITADLSNPDLYLTNFGYDLDVANTFRFNQRAAIGSTFDGSTQGIQMEPFRQQTVFNWYLSDYAPSGAVANAGLVAPEMQLANEQDVIRNINYFYDLIQDRYGIAGSSLAGSGTAQQAAYNNDPVYYLNDDLKLNTPRLVAEYYPTTPPTPSGDESVEYAANLELIDKIDLRLTYGAFKARYPIDDSDDGVDGEFQNPREAILDAITYGTTYVDPYDGSNDESDRFIRIRDALYLFIASPDFQIRY